MKPEFGSEEEHFLEMGRDDQERLIQEIMSKSNYQDNPESLPGESQIRRALEIGIEPTEITTMDRENLFDAIGKAEGSYDTHARELATLTSESEASVRERYPRAMQLLRILEREKGIQSAQQERGVFSPGAKVKVISQGSKFRDKEGEVIRQEANQVFVKLHDGKRWWTLPFSYHSIELLNETDEN